MTLRMSRILFENSKFALGFAAVTVVGAGLLMGTDNSVSGVELEGEAEPAPTQQVGANDQPKAAPTALPEQPVIADWASDEELVDTAEGFDPTPDEPVEILNDDASGVATGQAAPSARSASAAAPKPNVGSRPGPAPATPKSASRKGALSVR